MTGDEYASEHDEEVALRDFCAICWQSLRDEPSPLARRCDDGSVLRCHRRHALTARVHGFREPVGLPPAPARRPSWPAKELAI